MASFKFVTISNCATRKKAKGHPYWFHERLRVAAKRMNVDLVLCGPQSESSTEIIGLLKHSGKLRPASSVFGMWQQGTEVIALGRLFSQFSQKVVIHVYEGGFRELILVRRLLRSNPNSTALFNLNLTDPWHLLIEGDTFASKLARKNLKMALEELIGRAIFFAETRETADLFSQILRVEFTEYPLFATAVYSELQRFDKRRKYDAVFFPADQTELELVINVIQAVRAKLGAFPSLIVPRWRLKLDAETKFSIQSLGASYLEETLPPHEYSGLYSSAKIAVFPYESSYYRHTSSGRVLDAAAAGCFCIAPSESLPGRQIDREGWGSFYSDVIASVEGALMKWEDFVPGSVPTAENALAKLTEMSTNLKRDQPVRTRNNEPSDMFLFVSLVFGTGVRSWLPRLIQAIKAVWTSRSSSHSPQA